MPVSVGREEGEAVGRRRKSGEEDDNMWAGSDLQAHRCSARALHAPPHFARTPLRLRQEVGYTAGRTHGTGSAARHCALRTLPPAALHRCARGCWTDGSCQSGHVSIVGRESGEEKRNMIARAGRRARVFFVHLLPQLFPLPFCVHSIDSLQRPVFVWREAVTYSIPDEGL